MLNFECLRGEIRASGRVTVFLGFLPLYEIFKKKLTVYPSAKSIFLAVATCFDFFFSIFTDIPS